jgi:arginine deiminase
MKYIIKVLFCCYVISILALIGQAQEKISTKSYVVSDIAPLKKVIILSPLQDYARQSYYHYADKNFSVLYYEDGMISQHRKMVDILKENSVEVLNILDLLENAIANARKTGELEKLLEEIFPRHYLQLKGKIDKIDAAHLLGSADDFFYHYDDKGRFYPLIPPTSELFYTRDFAATTPKGVIITNSKVKYRHYEHSIGRFMFTYADTLKDYKIAFDAEKEGVRCEGGDIIIKDENTILMGINNFSDAEAAKKIAQKLNMDVIGVAMPPFEDFSGTNIEIMHLDTVFNLVDKNKALTVPFLFEKKYAKNHPIAKILKAINERIKAEKERQEEELGFSTSFEKALKYIPQVGWLTHYKAGSGEAIELNEKLVDYLREQGYKFIWVGGDRNNLREDKYILARALYELSLQAANVVQLAPGKVLAYAHNKYTIEALKKGGIEVLTFEGKYLADDLGGPHCLTMPLVRQY